MSAALYLTRALHMPVSADGCSLKNSFGVVVATAVDPITATAMAEVINLGHAGAIGHDQHQEIAERRRGKLLRQGVEEQEVVTPSQFDPGWKGRVERAHRRHLKGADA